eukprot:9860961-Lingulodinium_polyedra.AAC.1
MTIFGLAPLHVGPPEMFTLHRWPNGEDWAWCACGKHGDEYQSMEHCKRVEWKVDELREGCNV